LTKKIEFNYDEFVEWFDRMCNLVGDKLTKEQCDPTEGRVYHTIKDGNIVENFVYWFGKGELDEGETKLVNGKIKNE
jgi:hypothetical protein